MLLIESNKGWCQLVVLCFLSSFLTIDNFDKLIYKDFINHSFVIAALYQLINLEY